MVRKKVTDNSMYIKENLDNGIPIIMERMTNLRSFCIGIWVKVGSRNESRENNGITHFLEHMFFRGTRNRSAKEIAVEIDSLGGELNAFTTKEYTVFYTKVLDEHLEIAVNLLTDIIRNSIFSESDIEREKNIILEEIKGEEDSPDDYIHDLFYKTVWGNTSLGQSVLGKTETISFFTKKDLLLYKKYYNSNNIIIAAAGNFKPKTLVKLLNSTLGNMNSGAESLKTTTPLFQNKTSLQYRDLTEVLICLGFQSLPMVHQSRYALYLLNTITGNGMSSRLFQKIRENRGLAYSVYSYLNAYFDTGIFGVYVGTSKENAMTVVDITVKELSHLKFNILEKELEIAKKQLKGNFLLDLESSTSLMTNIAKQEIYLKRYYSISEIIEAIELVSLQDVVELANTLFDIKKMGMTILGPLQEEALRTDFISPPL